MKEQMITRVFEGTLESLNEDGWKVVQVISQYGYDSRVGPEFYVLCEREVEHSETNYKEELE